MFILNKENSIANHFLAELREVDIQKDRYRFRRNLERLAELLAYEISKTFYYEQKTISTPLETTSVNLLSQFPVIISILRAGIPFHQGFLNVFDHADSGFVGAYRSNIQENDEFDIFMGYKAAPDLKGKVVILADPMLATGKSVVKVADTIKENGLPEKIIIASAIAAPEALLFLENNMSLPFEVYTAAVDEKLNDKAYIVPGLGDAGDLSFGSKLTS